VSQPELAISEPVTGRIVGKVLVSISRVRISRRATEPSRLRRALASSSGLFAQDDIPAGTILPLELKSSLNSRKMRVGQVLNARVMQDVPLSNGSTIHAGAKVVGHVAEVLSPTDRHGAQLSFQFDTLEYSKHRAHVRARITTNLRALASMMEVEEAQLPKSGPDRGTSQNAWTTEQIGGDVVYRGGGPVANGLRVVGKPTANGVLVRVASKPGTKCRGDIDGNDQPQALWLFSSDACGTYGFSDLTISHAGRTAPMDQITLTAARGHFNVRSGSGLLLRVNGRRQ
jgi:hypothetical protein